MFWYSHSKYDYISDENSEYNSDSGDDLPNLTRDKQRVLRKYKYLNHSDCSRKEYLYALKNVQPEGWRTFHEVIRIGQPQKIKIDMDGELEKFASYLDPLDRIEKALGQKSFDGYIANTHLYTWQKSTDIIHKKDEISLYIKNALRIAIKEMTRKFTSRILELLPERMHPFIDEKSLITHIEKDSIELWPYEWEEDKKLKNESVLREESDIAIKIVEKQFLFLSYRNSNNGFDIFDRIRPTTCSICEKEHTREADHNKKKVIPYLDRLRARLQYRSQSYLQNNFTAVGKNIEIYNAKTMHSYNLQAKLTSNMTEIPGEDMPDVDDNEDGEGNRPTDQSIISLEKESRKRPSKDIPENKLSSKKVKTKDGNISILKKLIEELKSPSFSTSSTTSQAESITSPSNFSDLYSAIVKAEERIESVNQKIIICYFAFEKKLKERLAEYMKDNKKCRSQRKLYKEVEKQLPSNLSKNAIEKRIKRARKIYDLFSSIYEDKIE
ncbi:6723_t:CDS:2 [Racocetra persica]|uniref:6723_t:CDS:1 n=1 Tax=Racocetra persica TaxID=160502 RepID=A0ACA9LLM7_9GLOM|nr:6723_t:CDS:2 [Racocetra persica]